MPQERTGASEADVLKQDASTYVPKMRLSKADAEKREGLEEDIDIATKEALGTSDAAAKAAALKVVEEKKEELKQLMAGVEVRYTASCWQRECAGWCWLVELPTACQP